MTEAPRPPSQVPDATAPERSRLPVAVAAVIGVLVGIGATIGLTAAIGGSGDDVDRACAVVSELDTDNPLGNGLKGDAYRLSAAGALFIAASGGDQDRVPGTIGSELNAGLQRNDEQATKQALVRAGTYCDER